MKRLFTSLCVLALSFVGAAVASAQAITYFNEDFSSITTGSNSSTSGSNSSWSGNSNFSKLKTVYQAGGAIKIGSGSKSGSITTKNIDLSQNEGSFVVEFDVKGWSSVEGQIKVTVTGQAEQTVTYTATLSSNTFENVKLYYTGGSNNATVTIATTQKRAFLDNIKIYPAYKVQMSDVKHATIATALPYILPTGLKGNTVSIANGKAQITEAINANQTVAANQGILLTGEAATYYLQIAGTQDAVDVTSQNALKPALSNDVINGEGKKLYILANDANQGLGFYFQGESGDGSSVSNLAGKAYLAVDANIAPTQGFSFSDIVSAIEEAVVTPENDAVYDLYGRRVSTPAKGLYIVNGKKVIL